MTLHLNRYLRLVAILLVIVVPGAVTLIPPQSPPKPMVLPVSTDQTSICAPGPIATTIYAAGDAPLTAAAVGDIAKKGNKTLTMANITRPVMIESAKRFAAGVLAKDKYSAGWSHCLKARTDGVVQIMRPKAAELLLVNIDETPAAADFSILGPSGEITAVGSAGISVPAHSARPLPLSVLVPKDTPIGVEMRVSTGRLAVVGQTWLSAAGDFSNASTPAKTNILPGIFAGAAKTTVMVSNAGNKSTVVNVSALTSQKITLSGGQKVDLGPRSTVSIDLTAPLAAEAASLMVEADSPVTATVFVHTSTDYAITSAATPMKNGSLAVPAGGKLSISNPAAIPVKVTLTNSVNGKPTKQTLSPGQTWTSDTPTTGVVTYRLQATAPIVGAVSFSTATEAWIAPFNSLSGPAIPDLAFKYQPQLS